MNQEILDKLHAALYSVAPIVEDRERLIAEMGGTIWIESLGKMLDALPESAQNQVVELLNADNIDDAINIFDAHGVDVEAIITEVSVSVMDEVVATASPQAV